MARGHAVRRPGARAKLSRWSCALRPSHRTGPRGRRDLMDRAARIERVDAAEVSLLAAWRPMRRATDAALVHAAQRGSAAAVEELFSRHWPDAYRTALLIAHDRAAAEDIAQEAFLSALRALPRF